ncbi:LCP family protein [Arthrobacter sp. NIO-1057]|uniref:LCP family protein n=1 Tax=Arthrobacter sp. NIO-1057 TaxID=993071 RepID=UPI00071D9953|nr:LCP family protein [Arthrobacter sp. NIO-1057]KSU67732.1 transcriptional regulator [Arthrobacter sp. NIO-1057]SCB77468.1 transcriptional attenuator, LytR family [Arthrobacter sp. NIO-1057]
MRLKDIEDATFASRSARYGAERKKKRRVRTILTSIVAVVLVATLGAGYYVFDLQRQFKEKSNTLSLNLTTEQQEARPVKDPDDGSMNFLLIGVDHADEDAPSNSALQGAVSQRSDSMMLVHIPEDRSQIYVMSLVRDMYVDIPGYGKNKLNAAVSLGGVPLLLQTVEGMFDTKVDHIAMIDFDGFKELSTALGGVKVKNDIPFTAHDTDYFYPAGDITLEGDRALRFVRERKSFTNGDYQRVANQRKFIAAAAGQLLSKDTLSNPVKLYDIVDKVSPYLTFDDGLDAATMVGLGKQLSNVDPENMAMLTVPTAGTSTTADGQSIELADEAAISKIGKALQTDSMSEYLKENPPEEN